MLDLFDSGAVSATLERRPEERGDDVFSKTDSDDPGAETQHVRVVVLSCHACAVSLAAHHCAHTGVPIGGHRHSDARSAYQHREAIAARDDANGALVREVRIVAGLLRLTA